MRFPSRRKLFFILKHAFANTFEQKYIWSMITLNKEHGMHHLHNMHMHQEYIELDGNLKCYKQYVMACQQSKNVNN